jgi:hypothetical protein
MLMLSRLRVASFRSDLPVKGLERVRKLPEIGVEHRRVAQPERFRQIVAPVDPGSRLVGQPLHRTERGRGRRVEPVGARGFGRLDGHRLVPLRLLMRDASHCVDRIPPAGDLGEARVERRLRGERVGLVLRRVELEQEIACLDRLSRFDMVLRDPAGIERLDHLGIACRLDLAGGDRVNVEPAEPRPYERGECENADRRDHRDWRRRRRRLEDFERGGQKFTVAAGNRGRLAHRWQLRLRRRRWGLGPLVHTGALA